MLQIVGHVCFMAGDYKERRRCREFLTWLLAQRRGSVTIADVGRREDATEIYIPDNCKGWVTGNRGSELRRMETATETFMFMALNEKGEERLVIFCWNEGSKVLEKGRMAAERLVNEMIQDKLRGDGGRDDSRGRSPPRRGRSDSRGKRSPSRRRSPSR